MDFMLIIKTVLSMGGIALVAGVVLYLAAKKFAVFEDPLIGDIEALLPGVNCGGCGQAGCHAFAEKIAETKDLKYYCPVGGSVLATEIAGALGLEAAFSEKMVARVYCNGGSNAVKVGEYQGIESCAAMAINNSADLVCTYGCLGLADCVKACPFDAIHMVDGVAVVDDDKCTACSKCIVACPRALIEMTPYATTVYVACKSPDPGAVVRKYCSVGCIGCKACVKACVFDAITCDAALAVAKPTECTECLKCIVACKPNTIRQSRITESKEESAHDAAHV